MSRVKAGIVTRRRHKRLLAEPKVITVEETPLKLLIRLWKKLVNMLTGIEK